MPIFLLLCAMFLTPRPVTADPATHFDNVRPVRPWIAEALAAGRRGSPTLAHLVDAIEAAPLIVHLTAATGDRRGWDGRIQFVGASEGWVYVRVELQPYGQETTTVLV